MSRSHKVLPYYECHITVEKQNGSIFDEESKMRELLQDNQKGAWKFSKLEADIVLGPGSKMYATTHFDSDTYSVRFVKSFMANMVHVLEGNELKVVRSKIETVIYDQLH